MEEGKSGGAVDVAGVPAGTFLCADWSELCFVIRGTDRCFPLRLSTACSLKKSCLTYMARGGLPAGGVCRIALASPTVTPVR